MAELLCVVSGPRTQFHTCCGEIDLAADWYEKAIAERDFLVAAISKKAIAESPRASPLWPKVAALINLPEVRSYQATSQLTFSGAFSIINNQNPAANITSDYLGTQSSGTLLWNPAGSKRLGFQGTYTYAATRSSISFLVPQTLERDQSRYDERAHAIQGMLDFALPRLGAQAKLSAGGHFCISSGSRPTTYFQPAGKLVLPLSHAVA